MQKGSVAVANLNERKVNLGYWRKKIFYALMREVILASGVDNNVTSANEKAKYIVDGYDYYSRLLVFMNSFITSDSFRVSLCQKLRFYDIGEVCYGGLRSADSVDKLDKIVVELSLSCGKGVGSSAYVLGNSHTKELYRISPKKAELTLILNSLVLFMVEVYKMKLHTCSKSVLTKHINDLLKDFNLERIAGKLNRTCTSISDAIRYDRYTEDILISMIAVKNVVNCEYKKFKDNKENMSCNVKGIINDMSGYINFITTNSAIYDIGLESLINCY